MSGLDLILRPFQSVDVTPPFRVVTGEDAPQNVVLSIGAIGEGKTFNGSTSNSASFYMVAHQKEVTRKVDVKRIENPDDPDQFVKVEDVKQLTTKRGTGQQYQETVHSFKNREG